MFRSAGARLTGAVTLAVLMLTASAPELRAQGLKLTGYGDLEWTLTETGDPNDTYTNFFDNHHFNLVAVAWVVDDLVAAAEVEYEHAGEEIALEYGYLAYTGIRNLRLVGGKFIVPFNRWNKDLHPTIISKVPGRPLPYVNVFPSTYSDVGVWVTGGIPAGMQGARVTYDAYVVNGLKGDQDAFSFRGLRDNDRDRGDDNKSFGGRLGIELPQGLGLGVSGYTGRYAVDSLTADGLNITFVGGDADYHMEELELRGEFVYAKQDLSTGDTDDRTGFYVQAAYLLGRASESLANLEPVVRYSWVNFEGEENDLQEVGVGASYYVSASSSVRLAYFFTIEKDGFEEDNDKLMAQFNILF